MNRAANRRAGDSGAAGTSGGIPRRRFGRSDELVSAIALGGAHIGGMNSQREAIKLVHAAIDGGITFMDNAWEYQKGRAEEVMGKALANGWRQRVFLMTKVCTHGRGRKVAMRQLEQSLTRLKTDHLDLWQVHECIYYTDPENHFAKGGVVDALLEAKEKGLVRYIGFTGHKDPAIHQMMLAYDFPFDSVQMPLNCFDASFKSFERNVLPAALAAGLAVLGMKSMGGEGDSVKKRAVTAEEALRYAMSLPVTTTVSGIDSMTILRQNLRIAQGFAPMSQREMRDLRRRVRDSALDGRFELYKTTAKFDGGTGREQHAFPSQEEMGG